MKPNKIIQLSRSEEFIRLRFIGHEMRGNGFDDMATLERTLNSVVVAAPVLRMQLEQTVSLLI